MVWPHSPVASNRPSRVAERLSLPSPLSPCAAVRVDPFAMAPIAPKGRDRAGLLLLRDAMTGGVHTLLRLYRAPLLFEIVSHLRCDRFSPSTFLPSAETNCATCAKM